MPKKTVKFDIDEDHTDFEKVRVNPTKAFDINELNIQDPEGYTLMSNKALESLLIENALTKEQIQRIKTILKSRK